MNDRKITWLHSDEKSIYVSIKDDDKKEITIERKLYGSKYDRYFTYEGEKIYTKDIKTLRLF